MINVDDIIVTETIEKTRKEIGMSREDLTYIAELDRTNPKQAKRYIETGKMDLVVKILLEQALVQIVQIDQMSKRMNNEEV